MSPRTRHPHFPASACVSLLRGPSGLAVAPLWDPLVPSLGPAAAEPRCLLLAAPALRELAEAGAQVAEGPDPCAPRSSLNPPLFPWQQTEVS